MGSQNRGHDSAVGGLENAWQGTRGALQQNNEIVLTSCKGRALGFTNPTELGSIYMLVKSVMLVCILLVTQPVVLSCITPNELQVSSSPGRTYLFATSCHIRYASETFLHGLGIVKTAIHATVCEDLESMVSPRFLTFCFTSCLPCPVKCLRGEEERGRGAI